MLLDPEVPYQIVDKPLPLTTLDEVKTFLAAKDEQYE